MNEIQSSLTSSGPIEMGPVAIVGDGGSRSSESLPRLSPDPAWAEADPALVATFERIFETSRTSLDTRLEPQAEVSLERVRSALRLMHGEDGYMKLRSLGANFVDAWRKGRPDALSLLDPVRSDPVAHYGLLRLALSALSTEGDDPRAHPLADDLASSYREQIDKAYAENPLQDASPDDAGQRKAMGSLYYELVATSPTTRQVFDALAQANNAEELESALAAAQQGWKPISNSSLAMMDKERIAQLGSQLVMYKYMNVVQGLLGSAKDTLSFAAPAKQDDRAEVFKCARSLLEIAGATVSGSLLEKFATSMLGTRAPKMKQTLFGRLHQQAQQWPEVLWASSDARTSVMKQLQAKQATRTTPMSMLAPAMVGNGRLMSSAQLTAANAGKA